MLNVYVCDDCVSLQEGKDSVAKIKTSLLNLVDLAGSERQRDTRTAGLRLKVGTDIMFRTNDLCFDCIHNNWHC